MDQFAALRSLLSCDGLRRAAIEAVAALALPECWIGAGFVRDAVWDDLHGYGVRPPAGDVDVLLLDRGTMDEEFDQGVEQQLRRAMPGLQWSAKNQARMHLRNRDEPYLSVSEAMEHWPETATAVAVRLDTDGQVQINAPFGLQDLFGLKLRPTPAFRGARLPIFRARVSAKRWLERYPLLVATP